MKNKESVLLKLKLRNKLSDVSYKNGSDKFDSYVIFLDSLYNKALNTGYGYCVIDSSKPHNLETQPYETWKGLNGDTLYICWVLNKGIDNIDIFKKIEC